MNKKKVLLTVLAMVLVCVMSVMGTLAYLAENGGSVTNTFVAYDSPNPQPFATTFEIKEYEVEKKNDGSYDYKITDTKKNEVTANSYDVLPGVTLPKDAFVKLERSSTVPAYLFIEVVNELDTSVYNWSVNNEVWGELTGVTGKNGGKVYVLGTKDAPTILNAVTGGKYHILKDNKITVENVDKIEDLKITDSTNNVIFYAYLAQATVSTASGNSGTAADVYTQCFLTASGN